jgi:hypothetical protein
MVLVPTQALFASCFDHSDASIGQLVGWKGDSGIVIGTATKVGLGSTSSFVFEGH